VLIHSSIYDRLKGMLVERAEALDMGDPTDENTTLGPIINEDEAKRIESWVNEAVEHGASLLTGGGREGAFYPATMLENVRHSDRVWCEEVFGPVTVLEPYDEFAEAVRRVDDSDYGLQAGVFTKNMDHAFYAWNELEVGGVVVNDIPSLRVDSMPYGGVKGSGIGREGVRYAMEEYSEIRLMVVNRMGRSL
jgi:acyl-CoA reductase-like NAD-dependent aldehyde dehydrogenase